MVAACLGQFGRDLRQRRCGGRKLNVGRLDAVDLPVAQHAGDPDLQAARFHHAIRRGDPGIETQQADVRAYEGRGLVAHGRHAGHEFLGRQPQVAGTKPHGGILHRPQAVDDRLKLGLRLPAEPLHLVADVDRHQRPAGIRDRPQEVLAAAQPTLLILLAGAAAGLDVAVEFAGEHHHRRGCRPVFEDPAVPLAERLHDGINDVGSALRRCREAGQRHDAHEADDGQRTVGKL